jgi:hypothetical protein
MFQLTAAEDTALRSQFATSKITVSGRGGRRYLPYAFTEHGAIPAASALNSPGAVEMGIYVVRAFVQLRELLISNKGSTPAPPTLDQLEARIEKTLATHDDAIAAIDPTTDEPAGTEAPWHRFSTRSRRGAALHRPHRQQTLRLVQRAADRLHDTPRRIAHPKHIRISNSTGATATRYADPMRGILEQDL